jgi:glutaredoxin
MKYQPVSREFTRFNLTKLRVKLLPENAIMTIPCNEHNRGLMKYFFRLLRLVLTPPILFLDWLTTPRGIERSPQIQRDIDEQTSHLMLYHYRACPFCIKVKRQIKRLSLKIEMRDAHKNPAYRVELVNEGGKAQVPCLQIRHQDGRTEWLYESDNINKYLTDRFAESGDQALTDNS